MKKEIVSETINRPVFDMIRTVATIMVFLIHFLGFRNVEVPLFVFRFFEHCSYGVSFFFAISGYLVMQSYASSKSLKEFYVKRVSRIVPAYYVILIFGIVVWDICLGQMPEDTMLGIGWLRYFLFLNTVVPSDSYYSWNDLWGLWTMSCFMFFYIFVPIIKKYVKSYNASLVFIVLVILAAYGTKAIIFSALNGNGILNAAEFAGDSPVFNMISFSFGVAAWYAVREGKSRQYLSVIIVALAGFLLIREDTYNRIIWSLFAVAFMLAMKDFEYSNRTRYIGRAFAGFSKYSFTIYLVHMPILNILEYISGRYVYLGFVPFTLLTLVITALSALVINHFVEEPFAKLIKRLL